MLDIAMLPSFFWQNFGSVDAFSTLDLKGQREWVEHHLAKVYEVPLHVTPWASQADFKVLTSFEGASRAHADLDIAPCPAFVPLTASSPSGLGPLSLHKCLYSVGGTNLKDAIEKYGSKFLESSRPDPWFLTIALYKGTDQASTVFHAEGYSWVVDEVGTGCTNSLLAKDVVVVLGSSLYTIGGFSPSFGGSDDGARDIFGTRACRFDLGELRWHLLPPLPYPSFSTSIIPSKLWPCSHCFYPFFYLYLSLRVVCLFVLWLSGTLHPHAVCRRGAQHWLAFQYPGRNMDGVFLPGRNQP